MTTAGLDYPSQRDGTVLGPPEPMLLDTCAIQNVEWVWDRMEDDDGGQWSEERIVELETRYGEEMANELLALGFLVDRLQWQGFPWLVSASARGEIEWLTGTKGDGVRRGWSRLSEAQEDWGIDSFRGVAASVLDPSPEVRVNPLILRGLGVASVDALVAADGPLAKFRDAGDRALIRDALLSGVPAILTTDLRSFWLHRAELYDYGLEVWRPSDALTAYEPKWAAEEEHFARRRAEHELRRGTT